MQGQETQNLVSWGAISKSAREVKESCELCRSGQQYHFGKGCKFHLVLLAAFLAFTETFYKIWHIWHTVSYSRAKPEQLPLNPGTSKGSFWFVEGPFHTPLPIQSTPTPLQKNQERTKPIATYVYHEHLYVRRLSKFYWPNMLTPLRLSHAGDSHSLFLRHRIKGMCIAVTFWFL